MYRLRANRGILIFGLFWHEDRGLSQSFSPESQMRDRVFLPSPGTGMPFRDVASREEMGLSYVGHDDGQFSHALVLRLGIRSRPIGRAATQR